MTEYVLVNDCQSDAWVAERGALLAAIAALGWEPLPAPIGRGWVEPLPADEDDPDGWPYTRLCRLVPPQRDVPPEDTTALFVWIESAGADGAWVWVEGK